MENKFLILCVYFQFPQQAHPAYPVDSNEEIEALLRKIEELEGQLGSAKQTEVKVQYLLKNQQQLMQQLKTTREQAHESAKQLQAIQIQFKFLTQTTQNTLEPPAGKENTLMIANVENAKELWAEDPILMGDCVEIYQKILFQLKQEFRGYQVKNEGEKYWFAFASAQDAWQFAFELQKRMQEYEWPAELEGVMERVIQKQLSSGVLEKKKESSESSDRDEKGKKPAEDDDPSSSSEDEKEAEKEDKKKQKNEKEEARKSPFLNKELFRGLLVGVAVHTGACKVSSQKKKKKKKNSN
jgi:hypothetical protein